MAEQTQGGPRASEASGEGAPPQAPQSQVAPQASQAGGQAAPQGPRPAVKEGNVFALLAWLLGLVGVLIVFLAKRDDEFAVFHAKQSLVLNIAGIAFWIVTQVLFMTFFSWGQFGWALASLVGLASSLLWLGFAAVAIFGAVKAWQGERYEFPVLGEWAKKFKF